VLFVCLCVLYEGCTTWQVCIINHGVEAWMVFWCVCERERERESV